MDDKIKNILLVLMALEPWLREVVKDLNNTESLRMARIESANRIAEILDKVEDL